jgi:hypothetical protein
MIALLVIQIAAVWFWGIEPARKGLEELSADGAGGEIQSGAYARR